MRRAMAGTNGLRGERIQGLRVSLYHPATREGNLDTIWIANLKKE